MSNGISQNHPHLPFQEGTLEILAGRDHLYRHKRNEDRVIRWANEFGFGQEKKEKVKAVHEGMKKAKDLYEELTNDYHIPTAGFYPVVGHFRGRDVGSIVVSKWVEGDEYPRFPPRSDDELNAARRLFDNLTHYLKDKAQNKEPFLSDIGIISQYRYDPEVGEFVLIDTDPWYDQSPEAATIMMNKMGDWARTIMPRNEVKDWYAEMREVIGSMPEELVA